MAKERLIRNVFVDLAVLLCLTVPLLVIYLSVEPYHRGYFENDVTIRLPYKEQTISALVLTIVGFIINIVMILTIEGYRHKYKKGIGERFFNGKLVQGWIWESYRSIGIFTFGAACQQLTTDFSKIFVGRLRPHFFDVCQPVPVEGSPLNSLGYIQDYTCTGTDVNKLQEMRLSFPSAHASFAIYAAVFFTLYLQEKAKWRGSKLLRHGVQFLIIFAAWYVGLSRVVEHYHHWSDVLVGFLIGASYAYFTFTYVLKLKKYGVPVTWNVNDQNNVLPPV